MHKNFAILQIGHFDMHYKLLDLSIGLLHPIDFLHWSKVESLSSGTEATLNGT